jgi:periplasmic divalent cation tolerance protein
MADTPATDTGLCLVYVTASDIEMARKIGESLVNARLAACVNIIPGMRSIYRWENEVCEDSEVVIIAKTRRERLDEITATVTKIHNYDCPCVVAVPIEAGHQAFLNWIKCETVDELR